MAVSVVCILLYEYVEHFTVYTSNFVVVLWMLHIYILLALLILQASC